MVKVDIFSGFLGAGKTTLIKKLIAEGAYPGERLVLIENEFGEIAVDGGFLRDAGIEITEMSQGCICCSLVGDFAEAMHRVIEEFQPDRILVEPSGVGKLSDVVRAVEGVPDTELDGLITVADASKCRLYRKNFGEFYVDQVAHAACIVLSRAGKLSKEKLEECIALLREINPGAAIITTPWEELSGARIRQAMGQRPEGGLFGRVGRIKTIKGAVQAKRPAASCGAHEERHHGQGEHAHPQHGRHHHHADDVFSSFGLEVSGSYSEAQIKKALAAFEESSAYGGVLRAKGIVKAADGEGWLEFDYVPGETDIRRTAPDTGGRLCVIGTGLDKEALRALFAEA